MASASPWISMYDDRDRNIINKLKFCEVNISMVDSMISVGAINHEIKKNNFKQSDSCIDLVNSIEEIIKKKLESSTNKISIQTGKSNNFLQDKSNRLNENSGISISSEKALDNIAYKIKITKMNHSSDMNFDGSFVTFRKNNHVMNLGRFHNWWGSSDNTSLILSNFSRPMPTVEYKNYRPYSINILSKNITLNYSLFLKQFESNREVPNALLLGNRLSLQPYKNFEISLIRVAQFGGKGRDITSEVIKNLILGSDNVGSELKEEDESGNQIAGLDFNYYSNISNYKIKIYGQIFGEDGLDPIDDGKIFGAIFPSKRFKQIGFSIGASEDLKITLENTSSDSGYANAVYNHYIYRNGYRYFNKPLGFNLDADSDQKLLNVEIALSDSFVKVQYTKNNINKNSSNQNFWGDSSLKFEEISLRYTKYLGSFEFNIIGFKRFNTSFEGQKNQLLLNATYRY